MNAEAKPNAWGERREQRARTLAALGDPTRLGVMDLLSVQDLSPDALAAALEVPGNLLAHHLKVLEAAGLVQRIHSQHDKRRTYVQMVEGATDALLPEPSGLTATRVLFVCTHNSARSVLAEALWRVFSDVPSTSAGTHPAEHVNPNARKAAERFNLDLSDHGPQSIADVIRPDDVVISVCDAVNEELEPMLNPRIHWSIPDPAAIGTDTAFDVAVSELRERVSHLASNVTYRRNTRARKAHR